MRWPWSDPPVTAAQAACLHDHWHIEGKNRVYCGTCEDCGREIELFVLFDRLRQRLEAALAKAEGR